MNSWAEVLTAVVRVRVHRLASVVKPELRQQLLKENSLNITGAQLYVPTIETSILWTPHLGLHHILQIFTHHRCAVGALRSYRHVELHAFESHVCMLRLGLIAQHQLQYYSKCASTGVVCHSWLSHMSVWLSNKSGNMARTLCVHCPLIKPNTKPHGNTNFLRCD